MAIEALIFDVDGTLAETEEAHRAAFNAAFVDAGMDWKWSQNDYRILLKTTGGKERMKAHQETLPAATPQMSDIEIAALHAAKTKIYVQILAEGKLELRAGVAELITAARAAGIRVAIATTTSRPNVDALCECCWGQPADDIFEAIACGDQVANKKPAGDVFALALKRLNLTADKCVAFEDSLNGVKSAQACDLPVVVTPSIYTDDDDFSDAECVIATLQDADLCGAEGLPFKYPMAHLQPLRRKIN